MSRQRIQVKNLDRLLKILGGGALIREEMRQAFERSAFIVEGEAKRRAPVDRGRLRAGITHEVDSSPFPKYATVGTDTSYAKSVHDGRPKGIMPPVSALKVWADRHHMSAWAVAKSIQKHGIKPNPFLSDALEAKQGDVEKQFEQAMERVQKQWGI